MIRIQRGISSDPEQRTYFSREELSNRIEFAERGDGEEHGAFLTALLEIPGLAFGSVRPYVIVIVKAPPFSWEEIEPSILRLLTAFNAGEGALESEPLPAQVG